MAFPTYVTQTTGVTSTDVTSHAVVLPAGVTVGELLLVIFSADGAPTCTQSAGWTKVGQVNGNGQVTSAIFWKIATGSDALTVTTSNIQQTSHASMRIGGAGGVTGTGLGNASFTANSDPPAHTAPAAADILWIAAWAGDGNASMASAAPSGFTFTSSRSAGVTLSGAFTYVGRRTETAATVNPGPFTSTSNWWAVWTLAVSPAVAAGRIVERKVSGAWVPQILEKKVAGAWVPQIVERKDAGVWS